MAELALSTYSLGCSLNSAESLLDILAAITSTSILSLVSLDNFCIGDNELNLLLNVSLFTSSLYLLSNSDLIDLIDSLRVVSPSDLILFNSAELSAVINSYFALVLVCISDSLFTIESISFLVVSDVESNMSTIASSIADNISLLFAIRLSLSIRIILDIAAILGV